LLLGGRPKLKKSIKKLLPLLLLLLLLSYFLPDNDERHNQADTPANKPKTESVTKDYADKKETDCEADLYQSDSLSVHFIDVGQADSILVKTDTSAMLIDGGNAEDGNKVVNYLRKQGVNKIDYLVGTHPHEDHIGGLEDVLTSFPVSKVIMPEVTHNTATYESLLKALIRKEQKVTKAKAGLKFQLGSGVYCQVLSPINDSYDEINNYSAVIKLTYGDTSFLFTGDAEGPVEHQLLSKGVDLKANVLKVAHHGSRHSTSYAFLQAVSPDYAVITVGADNKYGFPHEETLRKLKGTTIYRTDLHGTVVFTSDGTSIAVKKEKGK